MRKIKFRAKSKSTKQWIYGYIREIWASKQEDCRYIVCPSMSFENDGWTDSEETEVIPETISQFTGLTDKNGVEIYEGDIVKVDIFTKNYCIVFGESEKWGASFQYKSDFSIYYLTESFTRDCLVIGNIFDNPELL